MGNVLDPVKHLLLGLVDLAGFLLGNRSLLFFNGSLFFCDRSLLFSGRSLLFRGRCLGCGLFGYGHFFSGGCFLGGSSCLFIVNYFRSLGFLDYFFLFVLRLENVVLRVHHLTFLVIDSAYYDASIVT